MCCGSVLSGATHKAYQPLTPSNESLNGKYWLAWTIGKLNSISSDEVNLFRGTGLIKLWQDSQEKKH